jgi:hypothetical protein
MEKIGIDVQARWRKRVGKTSTFYVVQGGARG